MCYLTRRFTVSEGDLNSFRAGNIRLQPRSAKALLSVDFARPSYRTYHPDTTECTRGRITTRIMNPAECCPLATIRLEVAADT